MSCNACEIYIKKNDIVIYEYWIGIPFYVKFYLNLKTKIYFSTLLWISNKIQWFIVIIKNICFSKYMTIWLIS